MVSGPPGWEARVIEGRQQLSSQCFFLLILPASQAAAMRT